MTMVGFLVTLGKAGIVFGLLAMTVKMLRRYDRRLGTGGRRPGAAGTAARRGARPRRRRERRVLDVVERAPLGRAASVVLVRVQDQHWVLGVTEQQVSMLLEVDLPDDGAIDLRGAGAEAGGGIGTAADGTATTTLPDGFGAIFRAELLRHTRRYLPGRSKVEVLDPASVHGAGDEAVRETADEAEAAGDRR
ncbi:MAG: flagellar biosynthetic protein FliO [Acidimicrobiales bacterium]